MAIRENLKQWGINLGVLLFSFGLIYGGMEAYVELSADDGMQYDLEMWRYSREVKRISANPAIGHEHRPNAIAHLMGVDVRTNSDGLRDRDFGATPQPGVTRIMMLGDSLTFGWGVPEEKTYSKRLEGMLARAGHRVEVINTGVGNYNTSMEVEYFLDRGVKYRPDIVVLNYFINDAEPMPRYDTTYFSRNLRAYVYFASRLDAALRQTDSGKRGWQEYYAALYDPALNGSGLASVRTAVKRLATYCQRNGIRLVLANYPELRVMKPYPFPYVDDFVRGLAAENSIPLIELLPEVEQADPETLWVTRPDPHPSVAAHEAFSQGLFAYFKGLFRVAGSK